MRTSLQVIRPVPWIYKLAALILVAGLLLLGVIGLILPVIPGLVFLFLALYVLTRVSRRASAYAHSKPWFRRQMQQMRMSRGLGMGARMKYTALLMARGIVDSLDRGFNWMRRQLRH